MIKTLKKWLNKTIEIEIRTVPIELYTSVKPLGHETFYVEVYINSYGTITEEFKDLLLAKEYANNIFKNGIEIVLGHKQTELVYPCLENIRVYEEIQKEYIWHIPSRRRKK